MGDSTVEFRFVKMHGAGNDFIVIDNRAAGLALGRNAIRAVCDRRRGVGADGVILLEAAEEAAFRMRYYNSDGGEAEMCGNGARCAVFHAAGLGLGEKRGQTVRLRFVAGSGVLAGEVDGRKVAISMADATGFRKDVSVKVAAGEEIVHFVNTGVPHAVVVVDGARALGDDEIALRGRAIREHKTFAPDGANVDFVTPLAGGEIAIRTYERGVEAETEACGTGAVAAAVVLSHLGLAASPVRLVARGGDVLAVRFEAEVGGASGVILEGPTAVTFEGTVRLSGEE
ncbi:MAG: diaminopimelate epimerase [Candidatus Krumholzibacteriia bacterium]